MNIKCSELSEGTVLEDKFFDCLEHHESGCVDQRLSCQPRGHSFHKPSYSILLVNFFED